MEREDLVARIEMLSERDLAVVDQVLNALQGMKENKYPFLGNFLQVVMEESKDPERFLCSMPIRRELLNPYRIVYGGITATLADMAMGWMLEKRLPEKDKFVTLAMNVNYHQPGTGKTLYAEARVTHQAQNIWQAACEIRNDRGHLVVTSTATFMQLIRKS